MTLAEHIRELRNRLGWSLAAIFVLTIVAFFYYKPIFHVIDRPYCTLPAAHRGAGGPGCHLYYFGVLEGFTVRVKVAFIAGVLGASPIWLYQLWAFIAPGLHRSERKWALWFVAASLALFAAGATTAYFILHQGLRFLLQALGNGVQPLIGINQYLSFFTMMLVVFGVAFEFPLLVVMLNMAGIVSFERLRSWRRMEIFLVFAFAAVATPSQDPLSMIAMALPMCLLYEVALIVARIHDRRTAQRDAVTDLSLATH